MAITNCISTSLHPPLLYHRVAFSFDILHFVHKDAHQISNFRIRANECLGAHYSLQGVRQNSLDGVKLKSSLLNFAHKISF